MGDSVMSKYVAHKHSLQCKLLSKRSKKDPVPTPAVADDAADVAAKFVVAEASSSQVPGSVSAVSPVPVDDSSRMSGVRGEILCQGQSLFDSFAQSLEARFTSIEFDNRFSQVMTDDSKVDDVHSSDVSQDVLTVPFADPSVVA